MKPRQLSEFEQAALRDAKASAAEAERLRQELYDAQETIRVQRIRLGNCEDARDQMFREIQVLLNDSAKPSKSSGKGTSRDQATIP